VTTKSSFPLATPTALDGLRDMLAEDVRLELVDMIEPVGAMDVGTPRQEVRRFYCCARGLIVVSEERILVLKRQPFGVFTSVSSYREYELIVSGTSCGSKMKT
jgi:hypothetical protein